MFLLLQSGAFPSPIPSPKNPILDEMDKYGDAWTSLAPANFDSSVAGFTLLVVCIVWAYLTLIYFGHSLDHQRRRSKSRLQPPIRAEFALYLLLNGTERDAAIGDLIERYPKVVKRYGKRKADLWVWSQVIRSIGPVFRRCVTIGGLLTAAAIIKKVFGQK